MLRQFARLGGCVGPLQLPHSLHTRVLLRLYDSEDSSFTDREGKVRTFHSKSEENSISELVSDQIIGDNKSEEIIQSDTVDSVITENLSQEKFEKIAPVDFSSVENQHKSCFCPIKGWRLLVRGLPSSDLMKTRKKLLQIVQNSGEIRSVWLVPDPKDKKICAGYAYIYMGKYEEACAMVKSLSASMIEGNQLTVLLRRGLSNYNA